MRSPCFFLLAFLPLRRRDFTSHHGNQRKIGARGAAVEALESEDVLSGFQAFSDVDFVLFQRFAGQLSRGAERQPDSFAAGTGISSRFYDGENLLGAQRFRALTTMLPASGTQVFSAPAPQLAPGQESLVVFCQAFFLDAAGQRFVISSPSAAVVLDASF